MPRACSHCRESNKKCRVHVQSGVCGECILKNRRTCDVRITQDEWRRLLSERARLLRELKEAHEEQELAEKDRREAILAFMRLQERAEESRRAAVSRESSLRDQLKKIESEAGDAIAVEEAQILALERQEERENREVPTSDALALSPATWSIAGGVTDDFWDFEAGTVPWVVASGV